MDEFKLFLKRFSKLIHGHLVRLYNNTIFMLNKQATIKKMYEALIKNKQTTNDELITKLKAIKKKNDLIASDISTLKKENKQLLSKINILQDHIIYRE